MPIPSFSECVLLWPAFSASSFRLAVQALPVRVAITFVSARQTTCWVGAFVSASCRAPSWNPVVTPNHRPYLNVCSNAGPSGPPESFFERSRVPDFVCHWRHTPRYAQTTDRVPGCEVDNVRSGNDSHAARSNRRGFERTGSSHPVTPPIANPLILHPNSFRACRRKSERYHPQDDLHAVFSKSNGSVRAGCSVNNPFDEDRLPPLRRFSHSH
jgi:hypothetical protein